MRLSRYLLATEKAVPKDAELISHQLMLRAGLIRKVASGIYIWLPLGLRVLQKVMEVIRSEMNATGALEILMPNVIPAELWQETGRWQKYGPELLRLQDRHERDFCFGPTHEEVITDLARRELKSYKQLPLNLYQIQIKFRDEMRPRFGVMRGREFCMKDAYSFHMDQASLQQTYDVMYQTYTNIFTRLGLVFRAVEADTGAIGGEGSHEFQALAEAGEDLIFYSTESDYAANIETAIGSASRAPHSVKNIRVKNAKAQFFTLILRADHELNAVKVARLPMMGGAFTLATETEIRQHEPISEIVDRAAAAFFDCQADQVFDLRNVVEGDRSPDGKGILQSARGIEVGQIFQLKDKYSKQMKLSVLNEKGEPITPLMGCYGIGVTRVVAAVIEQNHDARGILWPDILAPFKVAIVPIAYQDDPKVKEVADDLYHKLLKQGIEVIIDDRDERPGVKFADLDLIGIPHRIVVSQKLLAHNEVEYKNRKIAQPEIWKLEMVLERFIAIL